MNRSRIGLMLSAILLMAVLLAAVTPVSGEPVNTVRVWVTYKTGRQAEVLEALNRENAQLHYYFPQLGAYVVTLPEPALNGILRNPFVTGVEGDPARYPIEPVKTEPQATYADTEDISGQMIPWGIDAVQARDVWDSDEDAVEDAGAPTGAGVTVCIIDTGYDAGHEDLKDQSSGMSQVDNEYLTDGGGHGSHVAGTIGALNNGLGVVGVSPGAINYHIVKIFDNDGLWTSSSNLVAAIYECQDDGADVISMSLGGTFKSRTEEQAFNALYSAGILHVAAAGNDGNTRLSYPASYSSVISVAAIDSGELIADFSQQNSAVELAAPGVSVLSTVPWLDPTAVSVNGVDYAATLIEFASTTSASGGLVDGGLCDTTGSWSGKVVLCERGDISFYDKVMNVQNGGGAAAVIYNNVPGTFSGTLGEGYTSNIIAVSMSQANGQILLTKLGETADVNYAPLIPGSGYEAWDGTSMATPHVSGVAALVWSSDLTLTNVEIREALTATAKDLGAVGRDNAFGYGLVQAYDAWVFLGGGGGVTPDDPPAVTISSPAPGATVSGTVSITADASDDVGVTAVEFFVDGESIGLGSEGSDGWSADWDTGAYIDGTTHTLSVTATDTAGQTDSDTVSVTVDNSGGGTTDPISLSVSAYKVRGILYADLTWANATSTSIDVFRDGSLVETTENDGLFTDGPVGKGGGSATYMVCEAGTATCSSEVYVVW